MSAAPILALRTTLSLDLTLLRVAATPHARRSAKLSRTSSSVKSRVRVGHPALNLGHLFGGEAYRAVAVLLHLTKHTRGILLALSRPCQNTVKNGLHLIFCHIGIIAQMTNSIECAIHQGWRARLGSGR